MCGTFKGAGDAKAGHHFCAAAILESEIQHFLSFVQICTYLYM